ncbi:MAG: coproporphyrinogen dehydrogenase HemZ, partial [Bacillota bacterium]|nr:coproporphyrinogen dehydrogenase HemZ [Bacillota bacterium]
EPNRSSEGIFIYNKISIVSDTTNTELEETKSKLKKCEAGFHDASQNDDKDTDNDAYNYNDNDTDNDIEADSCYLQTEIYTELWENGRKLDVRVNLLRYAIKSLENNNPDKKSNEKSNEESNKKSNEEIKANLRRYEIQKGVKRELKRQLYKVLSNFTGKNMPWGMLTGIRPAKIVHEMIGKSLPKTAIIDRLNNYYMVNDKKAEILYNVSEKEGRILSKTRENMVSVYIGIPFCISKCSYCSFTSNPIDNSSGIVTKYTDALIDELVKTSQLIADKGWAVQSVYIGGGTPTSIDEQNLKRVLDAVESYINMDSIEEYTLEAGRPDSINDEKLSVIKNSRVTRISINPQSMNDDVLNNIGRKHTSQDIVRAFRRARELGFTNINMDIIAGLPGETPEMFEDSLKRIIELAPESLTVHTLSVKRGSKLIEQAKDNDYAKARQIEHMVEAAQEYAASIGMKPYYLYRQKNILGNLENVGYCMDGFESVYNIQIMEEKQSIIALGAGAITKIVYPVENRIERAFNVKNVDEYIKRVDEMVQRKELLIIEQ